MGLTTPTGRYSPLGVVLVITTLPTSWMIKQSGKLCKACLEASKVMSSSCEDIGIPKAAEY